MITARGLCDQPKQDNYDVQYSFYCDLKDLFCPLYRGWWSLSYLSSFLVSVNLCSLYHYLEMFMYWPCQLACDWCIIRSSPQCYGDLELISKNIFFHLESCKCECIDVWVYVISLRLEGFYLAFTLLPRSLFSICDKDHGFLFWFRPTVLEIGTAHKNIGL